MDSPDPVTQDDERIAQRVREELARRRLSRPALADMARISLSTLEKALAGKRPFTLSTTVRLEQALGTALRPSAAAATPRPAPPSLADESLGAYARPAVRWIEGAYLTLRPSFSKPDCIYTYITTIRWIDEAGKLGFAESQRLDAGFEQVGDVSMPHLSGHIYLITNEAGQYRMVVLGRPTIEGTMYGILSTLEVGHGSQLMPSACPVVLMKAGRVDQPRIGLIEPDAADYAGYRQILDAATRDDYVRLHR